jgi:hypothetical protein
MKRKSLLLWGTALFILLLAAGTYLYVFRTGGINMVKAKTDYKVEATSLYKEFESAETAAMGKYAGKILEIKGSVVSLDTDERGNVTVVFVDPMMGGVTCTIDSLQAVEQSSLISGIKTGDALTIKGRCDGMLTDVKIVKCVIVK